MTSPSHRGLFWISVCFPSAAWWECDASESDPDSAGTLSTGGPVSRLWGSAPLGQSFIANNRAEESEKAVFTFAFLFRKTEEAGLPSASKQSGKQREGCLSGGETTDRANQSKADKKISLLLVQWRTVRLQTVTWDQIKERSFIVTLPWRSRTLLNTSDASLPVWRWEAPASGTNTKHQYMKVIFMHGTVRFWISRITSSCYLFLLLFGILFQTWSSIVSHQDQSQASQLTLPMWIVKQVNHYLPKIFSKMKLLIQLIKADELVMILWKPIWTKTDLTAWLLGLKGSLKV